MKILITVVVLLSISKYANAKNLFTTSFYNIEFSSKNIDDDKIKEINKIKKESILSVLKKTLEKENYIKVIEYLSDNKINSLIKNIIINDEKIINNQYFSKIKINFDKKKLINFLRENNFSYVEYHPDKFLLIIYERDKIDNNLFTMNNSFYKYFINNLENHNLFKIPNLDINDRFILKEDHILSRDLTKISNFSKKYNSNETIIVISETNKDYIDFNLTLYSNQKIIEHKFQMENKEFDSFFIILENETLNIWKQLNQIQSNYYNSIICKFNYFNLLELKEIRKNINNVTVIKDLKVKSLSYKSIEYDINYYGNLKSLFKIFELNNLKINLNDNLCIIRLQ